jgi:hypothetical protein
LSRRLAALAIEMRELDDYVARAARIELDSRLREAVAGGPLDILDLNGFAGLHPALSAALLREFLAARIGSLRRLTPPYRHMPSYEGECPARSIRLARRTAYAALVIERHPEAPTTGV